MGICKGYDNKTMYKYGYCKECSCIIIQLLYDDIGSIKL